MPDCKDLTTGGCQCGAVRYGVAGPPLEIYVCHCTECRKQSASAFGISVIVKSADVRLINGELQHWSRLTDSGRRLDCYLCAQCGSRIWHGDKDRNETLSIKGGSLDEPVDLATAVHIWTRSRQSGVIIPEHADRFEEEPD